MLARAAGRHFQGLSRAKVEQHTAPRHVVMNRDDAPMLVEKHHVDCKAHAERMHRAAAFEQQRFIGGQMIASEQTAHAFPRGFRDRHQDTGVVSANVKMCPLHSKPACTNFIAIGKPSTMNVTGKMNTSSGKISFTGASIACFSAR